MKAAEDIEIAVNKDGVKVPFRVGVPRTDLKFTKIKKGSEIPIQFLKGLIENNIELVADIKYVFRVPVNLPKNIGLVQPEVSKSMKIKKRKHSQESLIKIYNDKTKGFSALRAIGLKFGVKDRSSKRLIVEILRAQEERQRKGL